VDLLLKGKSGNLGGRGWGEREKSMTIRGY
jgi:hypothetical protein